MKLARSIDEPIRNLTNWDMLWNGDDKGLIACWERGREMSADDPDLADRAKSGQLVVLPWKGGVEKVIKKQKFGTFNYLAMWQGLRNQSLDIDISKEIIFVCSASGMEVIFTSDMQKFLIA